ncbi:hypothetical protein [Kitasatospora sp. NPDC088346]|uniref:hypothetical protein n=1 Tax=Kitasatospora sp. NPDC088346 TaxID=3364073 RepID=UPI0038294DBB
MNRTQEHGAVGGVADTRVSPPPLLAAGEEWPAPWSPRSRRIAGAVRWAVRLGELADAERIAAELHQDVAAERGPEHPEALAVREIRAYLAHLGGDHLRAARLYREVAALWAGSGASAYRTATANARASDALAAAAARPGAPTPGARNPAAVPVATLGPTLGVLAATGRAVAALAGRRTVVVTLVAAVVLGVTAVPPADRPGPRPQAGAPPVLAAVPVLTVLDRMSPVPAVRPLSAPTPDPTPDPTQPSAVEEAVPEDGDDQEPAGPAEPAESQDRGPAVRSAAPGRPAPDRPAPGRSAGSGARPARPRPQAPVKQRPTVGSGGQGDVCLVGSRHGLPQYLVDLCRQVYGR